MNDIVKELREPLPKIEGYSGEYVDEDAVSDIFREAADEIERLREALREFVWLWPRPYPSAPEDMMYQQACIDKARAALGEKE